MFKVKGQATEEEILQGCRNLNSRYQELLYQRYSPKMFAICLSYAKDHSSAEDMMQDGFIKVYNNVQNFRGEGSFEGWMRRIFVNTAIEHYRKAVPMYPLLDVKGTDKNIVEDNGLEKMSAQEIMDLIQKLAPGYKTVFNLYVIEGYSHREIGELLQISEGTSKSQLSRARSLLQEMILKLKNYDYKDRYATR